MLEAQVVKKALAEIAKGAAHYEYFFDNLKSPDWIKPLFDEGLFKKPLQPVRNGAYIGFPFWPESRYLARMAPLAPDLVLQVATSVPDTDNVRVHEDLAEMALGMPPHLAAKLAVKAKRWLESPYKVLVGEKLGRLISHLAKGSQIDAAMNLAQTLLAVVPRELPEPKTDEDRPYLPRRLEAPIDTWEYEQILEKNIPDLVSAAGLKTLELLCDLLRTAIRREQPGPDEMGEDYSFIWRPAIEDFGKGHSDDLRNLLVTGITKASETLMSSEGKTVLETIESQPYKVFRRIGLHLRRKFPSVDLAGATAAITDASVVHDPCLEHELHMLLRELFQVLPLESKQQYLGIVERGIQSAVSGEQEPGETEQCQEEQETASQVRYWQYTKLWPIHDYLDSAWRGRFEKLKAEFGELKHPGFTSYWSDTWVGPTSPVDAAQLRGMDLDELVSYLQSWEPSGGVMSPSREGLGRELASVVTTDPSRFAKDAMKFRFLDPAYVRALLSGLREVGKEQSFSWDSVLSLCRWVVDQRREIAGRKVRDADEDPDWGWTRQAVARLLSIGFEKRAAEIPISFRSVVWQVLQPLTEDPEPTPTYEAQYGGSNMDPSTLSINTVRGEAIHDVIRYAVWVRRHIDCDTKEPAELEAGFDLIPEVRDVLDYHLDPAKDPAVAIRAVYGWRLVQLFSLDAKWVAANIDRIFPEGVDLQHMREAAWEAYVTFAALSKGLFKLLYGQYKWALGRVGALGDKAWRPANPEERLAQHIMVFYWKGILDVRDPEGLLVRFFTTTPDVMRGRAIEFVGRSLKESKEDVRPEILQRLKALWELRTKETYERPEHAQEELATFGWWFASGKFEDTWAIGQLKQALNLTGECKAGRYAVKHLVDLVDRMPLDALECLSLMIAGDKKGWHIHGWKEDAREMLTKAMKNPDEKVRGSAEEIIHHLGVRGHLEFRDLLLGDSPSEAQNAKE